MISIRTAAVEDAEELLAIYRPYVEKTTVTFEYIVPTVQEFAERIRSFSSFYPYFVAEENGVISGYAYAHRFAERKAYDWVCEVSIYIQEDARGKGVGTLLYEKLLSALQKMGICQAIAIISTPNEPSVKFHLKMGFSEGVELENVGWKFGGWHGTRYMTCRLWKEKESPKPIVAFREI